MVTHILAILSGILLALSWPTFGFPFLLFFSFVPLLILEDIVSSRGKKKYLKNFIFSYITFFIWNVIDTWWIYYATLIGMLGAIILNSLFMTLVFTSYSFIKNKKGLKIGLIFFVVSWISFEKLHLYWDLSWSWLNIGNAFSEYYKFVQWYEYTGIFGGTLWVLVTNVMVFVAYLGYKKNKSKIKLKRKILTIFFVITIPCIISMIMYENHKIDNSKTMTSVVIQPNTDTYEEKFYLSNVDALKGALSNLENSIDSNTNYIFLPETIFSSGENIDQFENTKIYREIKKYIENYPNLNIVFGAVLFRNYKDKKTPTATKFKHGYYDLYNSAVQINNRDTLSFYHKSKFVPGVEIMPFANIMNFLFGNLIIDLGGISGTHAPQRERSVFKNSINDFKIAPVICYESIFGEFITEYVKNGADHICIITNDDWWNDTQGHKQHFSYARLRAIETRKSISRSANTGISGFIDERGNILQSLGYRERGVLKMEVPTNNKLTFYVKYGDYIAKFSIILMCIMVISTFIIKRKQL